MYISLMDGCEQPYVEEWRRMSRASGSRRLQLTSGERAHHGASPDSLSLIQKSQRTADLLQAVEARAPVLFGFLFAVKDRLDGASQGILTQIPSQFFEALPYILVVVVLAGFVGTARAPKAVGRPYVKERE